MALSLGNESRNMRRHCLQRLVLLGNLAALPVFSVIVEINIENYYY